MDYKTRIGGIVTLQEIIDKNVKEVSESLADKTIPLDERWEGLMQLCKNVKMPIQTYGDGFLYLLDEDATLYDDFYTERGETVYYASFFEDGVMTRGYPEENIVKWKEAVLQSGYGGFINNW